MSVEDDRHPFVSELKQQAKDEQSGNVKFSQGQQEDAFFYGHSCNDAPNQPQVEDGAVPMSLQNDLGSLAVCPLVHEPLGPMHLLKIPSSRP